MKSFALLTMKSSAPPQMKSNAAAFDEIKSAFNPPQADFIAEGDFILCKQDFTRPQERI
jgi:hypothetical protein